MGDNSPPFLYDHVSHNRFYGQPEAPFNPKAVTQASWTRPEPKPQPKAPYVDLNRHPDSYFTLPDGKSKWTPMSPKTKGRVINGRKVQLGLRVIALLGALGSLFCSIVIKNVATTVVWIVRVGVKLTPLQPAIAILHTLYGIYNLSRPPIARPPGTQATYMLFAATFDLGLIPFYVFAAYLGYEEYVFNDYDWTTLLSSDPHVTFKIARAMFLLGIIDGGLHAISLGISLFLGNIFRQITRLPPDMNPLEDNLTARPLKQTKSEIMEKRASKSTLGSDHVSSEDPLIGVPPNVPFTETRTNSALNGYGRFASDLADARRPLQVPDAPPMPPMLRVDSMPFHRPNDMTDDLTTIGSPIEGSDIFTRPTTTIPRASPVRERTPSVPIRSQCGSPASDNWIVFASRSGTPVEEPQDEHPAPRDPSSVYSREQEAAAPSKGGVMDWFSPQRYGLNIGEAITENVRGEYESVAVNEHYGTDDDVHDMLYQSGLYDHVEQDIGDHHIDIFQDHEELDEDTLNSLRVNPLALNPPSPQPKPDEPQNRVPSGRIALTDIPNLSPKPPVEEPVLDSPQKNGNFYGDLDTKPALGTPRKASQKKNSKVTIRKGQKFNAYGALKQHDDSDEHGLGVPHADPATIDGDRKGRVVSNSGADTIGAGPSLSYGNYIAGLGVGRRRDVSGKMAEEGRVEITTDPRDETSTTPIRAAGWARFAGL
ncbi:hypothetical protein BO70DRAFT_412698 [Aspergillus heteromorphus CBS 117.55]|uniref:Uncharacterized protein n=1 Tax=Aspergillus heteromorphus CBS 117.55 TaxID=1448321 RepID=A0A317VNF2_9EURO|nr:uncharacterized protein BO70DRAFT_412698 [Aspergillus heteromorphus CBS 117.55]PWY74382.1 hypothetical protein BO70DRAFT_412698 [Aspergillus heteromorphus CBS 117.55]